MKISKKGFITAVLLLLGFSGVYCQEQPAAASGHPPALDEETLKKANDHMASTKAFNVHNYIVSSIYRTDVQKINSSYGTASLLATH